MIDNDDDFEPIRGGGDVWRYFDYSDADVRQAKGIIGALDDRRLSTRRAAELTGFAAADFSRVRNADYGRFTLDRLISMLDALDRDLEVHLTVAPRRRQPAPAQRR